ncbi:MAG: hypothetical protein JNJ50_01740 [Acidobacteria bacterium]|nr:hypothetical protein [Acidobacteriota bacterium]
MPKGSELDNQKVSESLSEQSEGDSKDGIETGENALSAHPIAMAVQKLAHRIDGIEFCANTYVRLSAKAYIENDKKISKRIQESEALLGSDNPQEQIIGIKRSLDAQLRLIGLRNSRLFDTMVQGVFLTLFSTFDVYIGELLKSLYMLRPELLNTLNKTLTVSELLQYASIDDVKTIVLQNEVESFKRKSYIEQFEELESRFSISLTKFKEWPEFIERAQRRNLFAHCDGIVSDQYINICKKQGYLFDQTVSTGERLIITPSYFFSATRIVLKVAVMLGHALWRKVVPDEMEYADKSLNDFIFELLQLRRWKKAQMIGEFAVGLPKVSNPILKRLLVVNGFVARIGMKVCGCSEVVCFFCHEEAHLPHPQLERV